MFTGRTDVEPKLQYSGHLSEELTHLKSPWCWERLKTGWKGITGDEMVGWHHQLNGHEFEQAPGVRYGQEAWRAAVHGVAKSRSWLSNWTELKITLQSIVSWHLMFLPLNSCLCPVYSEACHSLYTSDFLKVLWLGLRVYSVWVKKGLVFLFCFWRLASHSLPIIAIT